MNDSDVKPGLKVITKRAPDGERGLLVTERHLFARRDAPGVVKGYVPGHGGDVWWVEHDDGAIGAYCFTEMEPRG